MSVVPYSRAGSGARSRRWSTGRVVSPLAGSGSPCENAGVTTATGWRSTATCRALPRAATAVLIGHLAGHHDVGLGAGGIMLPNHSPGRCGAVRHADSLYPDRIDLGLGRCPWQRSAHHAGASPPAQRQVDDFPADVRELMSYFGGRSVPCRRCRVRGLHVPIWLLGSSLYSAQLAAAVGLPFGFASPSLPPCCCGRWDLPCPIPSLCPLAPNPMRWCASI